MDNDKMMDACKLIDTYEFKHNLAIYSQFQQNLFQEQL